MNRIRELSSWLVVVHIRHEFIGSKHASGGDGERSRSELAGVERSGHEVFTHLAEAGAAPNFVIQSHLNGQLRDFQLLQGMANSWSMT